MEQVVRSCVAPGGEEIAYATVGDGPPLILAAWWTSHLELDWQNQECRDFLLALAHRHTVIRYDRPGVGMSGRDERPYDLGSETAYLSAVADEATSGPFDILGISCGGPPAMSLASQQPDRVRRLVLFASYVTGTDITDEDTRQAIRALVLANWGLGSQTLANVFLPHASAVTARRFASSQRHTASAGVAASLLDLTFDLDVADVVGEVSQPALVLHRERDNVIEIGLGRELADRLPEATFVPLEGGAHLPWGEDFSTALSVVEEFLTGTPVAQTATRRLVTVCALEFPPTADLVAELGDARWQDRLASLRRVIAEEAAEAGGEVVRVSGADAVLLFELPGDAIAFGIAARARARALELALSVGLHTGEVEQRGDEVTGGTVVTATELGRTALHGQVLLTRTTAELAAGRQLDLVEIGERRAPGIAEPLVVFEAAPMPDDDDAPEATIPRFRRDGQLWHIDYQGDIVSVASTKGIADLAALCGQPDRDVPAEALMDGVDSPVRSTGADALDREAISAYRARLGEIEVALDRADASGDVTGSTALDDERSALLAELRNAAGLGGRRRRLGDEVERARKAVSGRIRDAIKKLREHNTDLADHLSTHVHTGRRCRYET